MPYKRPVNGYRIFFFHIRDQFRFNEIKKSMKDEGVDLDEVEDEEDPELDKALEELTPEALTNLMDEIKKE